MFNETKLKVVIFLLKILLNAANWVELAGKRKENKKR